MEKETETEAETEAEPPSNASSALTLFILVKFETRDTSNEQRNTRQEDNLHDSVCDVMRFRIFTEIFV